MCTHSSTPSPTALHTQFNSCLSIDLVGSGPGYERPSDSLQQGHMVYKLPRPWRREWFPGASVWCFSKWVCLSYEPDFKLHKNKPGCEGSSNWCAVLCWHRVIETLCENRSQALLSHRPGLLMPLSSSASPVFCNAVVFLLKQTN